MKTTSIAFPSAGSIHLRDLLDIIFLFQQAGVPEKASLSFGYDSDNDMMRVFASYTEPVDEEIVY